MALTKTDLDFTKKLMVDKTEPMFETRGKEIDGVCSGLGNVESNLTAVFPRSERGKSGNMVFVIFCLLG